MMGQTNTVRFHWVAGPVVVVAYLAIVKILDDGLLGGCVGINEGGHVWGEQHNKWFKIH